MGLNFLRRWRTQRFCFWSITSLGRWFSPWVDWQRFPRNQSLWICPTLGKTCQHHVTHHTLGTPQVVTSWFLLECFYLFAPTCHPLCMAGFCHPSPFAFFGTFAPAIDLICEVLARCTANTPTHLWRALGLFKNMPSVSGTLSKLAGSQLGAKEPRFFWPLPKTWKLEKNKNGFDDNIFWKNETDSKPRNLEKSLVSILIILSNCLLVLHVVIMVVLQ